MILAFSGDRFLAEEAAAAELSQRGLRLGELPRLGGEGADISPAELLNLMSPSLFGEAAGLLDLAGQRPNKELLSALPQAAASGLLVVLDPSGPKTRAALYREHGEHKVLPAPQRLADLQAHVQERAQHMGLSLPRESAIYLAQAFGSDLASIASELGKLALLGGDLGRARVEQIVGKSVPGDSFALLEAITAGRKEAALTELRRLSEEDPFRLLGVFAWQYRLLAGLCGLLAQGGRVVPEQAASELGFKPYPVKKALPLARRLSESALREQLRALAEAERRAKNGGDPAAALTRLTLTLCALNRSKG